jgi:hypothetical protein
MVDVVTNQVACVRDIVTLCDGWESSQVDCGDYGNNSSCRLCDNTRWALWWMWWHLKQVGHGRCGQVDCIVGVVTLCRLNYVICMEMLHQRCAVFSKHSSPSNLKVYSEVSLLLPPWFHCLLPNKFDAVMLIIETIFTFITLCSSSITCMTCIWEFCVLILRSSK